MKSLRRVVRVFLVTLGFLHVALFGCTDSLEPLVRVSNPISCGPYTFNAPRDYWYPPRICPREIVSVNDTFRLTFYQDKTDVPSDSAKKNRRGPAHPFFSFVITPKQYDDPETYWQAISRHRDYQGYYSKLPPEVQTILHTASSAWSCKYVSYQALYGIDCITVLDHVVVMAINGTNEKEVLEGVPQLRNMLTSFRATKKLVGQTGFDSKSR